MSMMSMSVVVELSKAKKERGGRKARLQVSRWLVVVQVWSDQLVVAPLRIYYIA